ncbi:MAG: DUF262 domain-containing protein [Lachnospiraceae bacterium]
MLRSKPDRIDIDAIKYQIEQGELKVPQFQRDFVWSIEASSKLMDSIVKGYPIGAFTFWKTKDRLRSVKNIGGLSLPDSPVNDFVNYVLDGQQRITSIYACLRGVTIGNADYSKMYINLIADEDDSIVILDLGDLQSDEYISLKELLEGNMSMIFPRYGSKPDIVDKINDYKERINKYAFSVIELQDAPLDIATEIFTRINTTGKSLSLFEIMCAKTYDENLGFDLFEKRKVQLEKWANVNYDTVPHQTVLQVMSLCIKKSCRRRDILSVDKKAFINAWSDVDKAFDDAIDYMKSYYGIPVSKLLPYDALLVPIVYYFYFNKTKPTGKNALRLQDYFWRCVLTKRFTEGAEGKLATDCANVIEPILKDIDPDEKNLEPIDISYDSIKKNGVFSLSSAYVKGLVCILAAQHPKSFADGASVIIDNAWLSQSNSKNYHHFFPKAYMKKKQALIDEDLVNHIANITIVDGYLNKNVIKDKAPSQYMAKFKQDNNALEATMQTHLIDVNSFGIWNDDYSLFFENRIKKIQEQLKSRLIIKSYDKE